MKAIILCAGYATRLYPITKNFPKPLLSLAGKEILSYLVDKIKQIDIIDEIYVVTNDKYNKYFEYWKQTSDSKLKINIINDQTKSTDDMLGAIGDLNFVIEKENIDDDILVLAGDTVSNFDLNNMVDVFKKTSSPVSVVHNMESKDKIKNTYGCVEFDEENKITSFEEKPEHPKSTYKSVPFYVYPKSYIQKIKKYVSDGNDLNNIGDLITFFHKIGNYFVVKMEEKMFDIGNVDLLNDACEYFKNHPTS